MKKQYDISVILPVYNNVQYLEECLDSILAEEKLSIEIVAIDDGSTDGSEQILDEYAGKYENIRVFHQENSGVSIARNLGLEKAKGEYICYLDSDDHYCPGVLEKGFILCSEKKLDVLFFTYENYFENEIAAERWKNNRVNQPMRKREYPKEPIRGREMLLLFKTQLEYRVNVFLQMARRDFLQKNHFSFEPGIIFEDIPYTFEVLLQAERVMALNEVLVKRRIRDNSLEHRPTTVHRCKSAFRSLILDYKLVRHFEYDFPECEPAVIQELAFRHEFVKNTYLELDEENQKKFLRQCSPEERIFFEAAILPRIQREQKDRAKIDSLKDKHREKTEKYKAKIADQKETIRILKKEKKDLQQEKKRLQGEIKRIRKSRAFRLGRWILRPFSYIKRCMKGKR